ncbi:MAG: hypothetical protein O7G88_18880, partial [bacterium]|nr:hypothetical protein [bacterium]
MASLPEGLRFLAIDASSIQAPGAKGTDYRLHISEDRPNKSHFIAGPLRSATLKTPLGHPRAPRWRPSLAGDSGGLPKRLAARRSAAMRGLDMQVKMGYGSVSGVSPRQGLGT